MTERLTTLPAVKEWLDLDTDSSDKQLIRLIDAASQFILNWLNRDSFAATDYTQNFFGNGKNSVILRNWPIISISSVGVGGSTISASTFGQGGQPGSGYTIGDPRAAPQSITLFGSGFAYGAASQVVYRAGFETTQVFTIEAGTDPDTVLSVQPTAKGQWTGDEGVTTTTGPMTQVDADPVTGEYAVSEWGTYTFALADIGTVVTIKYSFVPWDVSFAATEVIGEWYKRKDRIGILSKTLGGQETITFSKTDMSDVARSALQPYMNVVPL